MADIKTEEIDFGRAGQLLNVVHLCAGVGPKLTSLGNAAMTELTKINDTIKVAAQEAEKERQAAVVHEQAKASLAGDPTKPEPDEDLKGRIKPTVFPSDSKTATIADNNVDRRV